MLEILKAVVYGLEVSMENEDIGGIASAFQFLEIAHIHYHGRDIKEEEARMRDDDEMSVISNTDSTISNLSDHSRDMSSIHSWVAETGNLLRYFWECKSSPLPKRFWLVIGNYYKPLGFMRFSRHKIFL